MKDLRSLPKVDALSRSPLLADYPERIRVEAARAAIEEARNSLSAGAGDLTSSLDEFAAAYADGLVTPSTRPAINLSGVILHTGLGRARLAPSVVEHLARVASGHAVIEFDLDSGKRGDRQEHVRGLLTNLTGAEDALVVNNAAAAVVLSLASLAGGRDVLLSRGQMIEIGGAFRMPDIVRTSGCNLVEVGCTNKTRLSDYEEVTSDTTGALLRCHTSNFKIIGFTAQPDPKQLSRLAHAYGVPFIDDMGTGCIVDTSAFGLAKIPTVQDSLGEGADVVTASGDKLLGGPQAGLILGRREFVRQIAKHPLARAFRVDKMTLAALEQTLRLYHQGREQEIPTIRYLTRSLDEVRGLATQLASVMKSSTLAPGTTEIGGGSAPGTGVPTWRIGLARSSPDEILKRLRQASTPVIGRIEEDIVWLDPRTLDEDETGTVREVLKSI